MRGRVWCLSPGVMAVTGATPEAPMRAPPARSVHSSREAGRRCRFRADRRRLASSRVALAARVGLVGLRFFRTASAAATMACNRSVTSSRFRDWLREPLDTSRSRPTESSLGLSRSSSRSRCSGVRLGEAATSHQTSIRVEEVLTCCPPGPLERDARYSSSDSGRRRSGVISRRLSSAIRKAI